MFVLFDVYAQGIGYKVKVAPLSRGGGQFFKEEF